MVEFVEWSVNRTPISCYEKISAPSCCSSFPNQYGLVLSGAGFSSERLRITHVSLGGETANKDLMNMTERNGAGYPPINEPISAADITKLQNHADFNGKSASRIQAKVVKIRRTILCAIDMFKWSDPATADGLQRLYRSGEMPSLTGTT